MLAATLAFEAMVDGADRERAVALARFSLDGDRLWAVDNGLFWVVAANVRMLADDDLGDFWARARAQAHARGSLFMALSTSVWEGYWRWRRGELDEALACLTAALDQDRMWGGSGIGEPYTRSFQIGCHLDRGDVAAARRVADAAHEGSCRRVRAAGCSSTRSPGCSPSKGGPPRRWRVSTPSPCRRPCATRSGTRG